MTSRKSSRLPLLTTIFGVAVLLALGSWQVQRLYWKEGLIAARQAAVAAPPTELPATLAAARGMEYRHVRASGTFLNDRELFLAATDRDGHVGYQIVTPLRRADGTIVLVERGWVPQRRRDPATRAAGEIAGPVTVQGLLRLPPPGKPGWFVPDNNPQRDYWFYVDIAAMTQAAGLGPEAGRVLPFYVDADATPNPGGLPIGGQTRLALPNDHLQYALTWYALAVALVIVYLVYRRGLKREEGQA